MTDLERVREWLGERPLLADAETQAVRFCRELMDFIDAHLEEDARMEEAWKGRYDMAVHELARLREELKQHRVSETMGKFVERLVASESENTRLHEENEGLQESAATLVGTLEEENARLREEILGCSDHGWHREARNVLKEVK